MDAQDNYNHGAMPGIGSRVFVFQMREIAVPQPLLQLAG
jgi:hypothetical protein